MARSEFIVQLAEKNGKPESEELHRILECAMSDEEAQFILELPALPADVAAKLNMTEGAIKTTVHRLRRRCRELLRDEIAQTVTSEDQIDDEIRGLFTVLAC